MALTLTRAALTACLCVVSAFPGYYDCNGPSWTIGTFVTDRMEDSARTLKDGSSIITITSDATGGQWRAGMTHTITVTTTGTVLPNKLQVSAGTITGGTSDQGPTCINKYPAQSLSHSYTFTSPPEGSGTVNFYILAGNADNVYLAPPFSLTEGPPATRSPTTTMSPTASPAITLPPSASTTGKDACVDQALSSFPCSYSDGGFKVEWSLSDTQIRFRVTQSTSGWVGLGYGSRMIGSYATIGWCSGGTATIEEYKLNGKSVGAVNTISTPVSDRSCTEAGGTTAITYTVPLSTSDRSISPSGTVKAIYAWGSNDGKSSHPSSNSGKAEINFNTGEGKKTEETNWEVVHGASMWLSFALFMPTGLFMASGYVKMKLVNFWFYGHIGAQFLAFVFALTGLIVALQYFEEPLESSHGEFGIAIFAIFCVQILGGIIRPKKEASWRSKWEISHKSIGALLLTFGLINVFLGFGAGEGEEEEEDEEGDGQLYV
ncbi:hypothetical protein AAMO2058_001397200 [Amorphochlora amoebiformis]